MKKRAAAEKFPIQQQYYLADTEGPKHKSRKCTNYDEMMIINWGSKVTSKKAKKVPIFCQVCEGKPYNYKSCFSTQHVWNRIGILSRISDLPTYYVLRQKNYVRFERHYFLPDFHIIPIYTYNSIIKVAEKCS